MDLELGASSSAAAMTSVVNLELKKLSEALHEARSYEIWRNGLARKERRTKKWELKQIDLDNECQRLRAACEAQHRIAGSKDKELDDKPDDKPDEKEEAILPLGSVWILNHGNNGFPEDFDKFAAILKERFP